MISVHTSRVWFSFPQPSAAMASESVEEPPRYTLSQRELYFPPHSATPVENIVTLTNDSNKPLLFKVKTSRPQRYSVKPKVGVVHPRDTERLKFYLVNGADAAGGDSDRFSVEVKYAAPGMDIADADACWPKGKSSSGPGVARTWLPVVFRDGSSAPSAGADTPQASARRSVAASEAMQTPRTDSKPSSVPAAAATSVLSATAIATAGAAAAGAAAMAAKREGLPPLVKPQSPAGAAVEQVSSVVTQRGAGAPPVGGPDNRPPAAASPKQPVVVAKKKKGFCMSLLLASVPMVLVFPLVAIAFLAGATAGPDTVAKLQFLANH